MPYCVDCKFYTSEAIPLFAVEIRKEDCEHPHWTKTERCHPIKRKKREHEAYETRKPSNYNAKCDCELYVRKWWKFWR